jgi:hypothetical protein
LQDRIKSPFRAADEINQGMDERNERLVFARIVANCAAPDSPQYFLVTPKLLPHLTAMEMDHVTVLFVFNAPRLFPPTAWDMDKFKQIARDLKRKRRGMGGVGSVEDEEDEGGADKRNRRTHLAPVPENVAPVPADGAGS